MKPESQELPEKKVGRPAAAINWTTVDKLLQAGCSGVQIAARLGVRAEVLYDACQREHKTNFTEYSQQKREHGETLIHEQQFALAMKGNLGMLIWLGKQRLGQKDKNDVTSDGKALSGIQLVDFDGSPVSDV